MADPFSKDELGKMLNLEQMKENVDEIAALLWAYYSSLVRAGFDETQALDIIKARGLAII